MAGANPFKKHNYASYREWEQELVFFLLDQLRTPNVAAWQLLATDQESRDCAAFMSHQLANIALVKGMPSEALLRTIFPTLMHRQIELQDLRDWFERKWIDQSRLHSIVDFALKEGISRATHTLVAS
jgi:hypothetical protein